MIVAVSSVTVRANEAISCGRRCRERRSAAIERDAAAATACAFPWRPPWSGKSPQSVLPPVGLWLEVEGLFSFP
jgi:hypothetical protein